MKEFQWPYSGIDKAEFLARIVFVEEILRKYGVEYIEDVWETNTWAQKDSFHVHENIQKRIWKRGNEYIQVGRVYFPEKPFLVLEFSENKESPYEDADPFPYDLSDAETEQEIKYSLGIETL